MSVEAELPKKHMNDIEEDTHKGRTNIDTMTWLD